MTHHHQTIGLILAMLFPVAGHCAAADAPATGFYKQSPLFSTAPAEAASSQLIARFGPVGIGIELVQPAFVMKVASIEKGSPAEATGKLKMGQLIETINGQQLAAIDPRIQLGQIITAAEAGDGAVKLMVKDTPEAKAEVVVVQIPVLGGWAGRGGVPAVTYGGGGAHLNAGGTAVVTFLMLAKECGADVPDQNLLDALIHVTICSTKSPNSNSRTIPCPIAKSSSPPISKNSAPR